MPAGWKVEQCPGERWECAAGDAISGEGSLHHAYDNPGSGCDYFVISHDYFVPGDSFALSFRVRHGYPPSSANNWQVALVTDLERSGGGDGNVTGIREGIILGVNFRGSDDLVRLWKVEEGSVGVLCETSVNYQEEAGTGNAPLFRIAWSPGGGCSVYCWIGPIQSDPDSVHPDPEPVGSCQLDELPRGRSLVIRHAYSANRDRNLWLDDLLVEGLVVEDSVSRHKASWGEVVINEVMADPEPPVDLATGEYLELYNRSKYRIDLAGWRVGINDRHYQISGFDLWKMDNPGGGSGTGHAGMELLPADDRGLEPGQYGVIAGLTLPNQEAELALYSSEGTLVHGMRYRIPWDGSAWKKEGGWSLEIPDPDMVCNGWQFMAFCGDRSGGTPGRVNSNFMVIGDREPPQLLWFGYGPGNSVHVHFQEPLDDRPGLEGQLLINPGGIPADSVVVDHPVADGCGWYFPVDPAELDGYRIRVPPLSDCRGNLSRERDLPLGRPVDPVAGTLVINEIMFCPLEGNPEYIELFNPGPGFADLNDYALDIVGTGASPDRLVAVSPVSRILMPGTYAVVARDTRHLMHAYSLAVSGSWVEMASLESMPDDAGEVYLTDRAGNTVDLAVYGEEMHLDLIGDSRGISLERVDWHRPGTDPVNWHSAASIEGYATPGRVNSQVAKGNGIAGRLSLDPRVFSPDNDGYRDMMDIRLAPGGAGHVVRVWITGMTGVLVRILANNDVAGTWNCYRWEGESDDGDMVPGGIYVVHVKGYDPVTGERWSEKAAAAVIYP